MDRRARLRFFRNRGAIVGITLVAILILFAIIGPYLSSHDAYTSDFVRGATPDGRPVPPSAEFWLGTDRLFRDQLARLAGGARLSLAIAFAATVIATVIGGTVGMLSGYFEGTRGSVVPWPAVIAIVGTILCLITAHATAGKVLVGVAFIVWGVSLLSRKLRALGPTVNADGVLMRIVDVGLSFPFLLLVMALGATFDRTNAFTILVTLGTTSWLGTARLVRAKTMQVRSADFVVAARALGQRTPSILVRHILPNVAGPLIVIASTSVAQMILAESVLSYLGVGISPPEPTWGHMLYDGQDLYQIAPWMLWTPAVAIVTSVFGFNLVGEGLRDALDPRE